MVGKFLCPRRGKKEGGSLRPPSFLQNHLPYEEKGEGIAGGRGYYGTKRVCRLLGHSGHRYKGSIHQGRKKA